MADPRPRGLELKIPPVAVVLICAAIMWALDASGIAPEIEFPGRVAIAAILAAAGVGVTIAGVAAFRSARTTVNPMRPDEASKLVVRGVYRMTRNPMYLGFLLLLLAWAAFLANVGVLVVVIAFVLYMNRFQIAPEERALAALFGPQFDGYKQRVRRWL